ncbi:MAG TPA: hypothetical protein VLB51_15470 [Methylomirabilota bacterium]|nr:hypothetical protein [Methylomirabilota bacterium]
MNATRSWWRQPVRRWLVRIAVVAIAVEVVYVVAANALLRTGTIERLLNKKPEKTHYSWQSASTFLPGLVRVEGFELRSQTLRNQIHVRVGEARATVNLVKLPFKIVHISGVDAEDVDFRYRRRLDAPPREDAAEERKPFPPELVELYPEIPGLANPPDPKPEDLYPRKKNRRPWTIKLTGVHVDSPVRVALNHVRIEGEGWVGGGVTVKPRQTITIHRGRLDLEPTTIRIGRDLVTDNLEIAGDVRFETFPARGARPADVIGGISGTVELAGHLMASEDLMHQVTPGLTTSGSGGTLAARLELERGAVRAGSTYSMESDAFRIGIMNLVATGAAKVSGSTERAGGQHVTTVRTVLDHVQIEDPADGSVDVVGSNLGLTIAWRDFDLPEAVKPSGVEFSLPEAEIRNLGALDPLFPESFPIAITSGTGDVSAHLEVDEAGAASGSLELIAESIRMDHRGDVLSGDLEARVTLADGDLAARRFDLSGTNIRLEHIANTALSAKQQAKLDPWFGTVDIASGTVTFARPMVARSATRLTMRDSRPVIALLRSIADTPGWMKLVPNIENITATTSLATDTDGTTIDDLMVAGDGLEVLGSLRIANKKPDGRVYVKYKALAAGIGFDRGKSKVHLAKPRAWYDGLEGAGEGGVEARESTGP